MEKEHLHILGSSESMTTRQLCWTFWLVILLHTLTVTNPHKGAIGLKREIFFLNLEDGYFGCQVNESMDVLKVFELSKLCDGSPQCFLGSDELHEDLKCTDDCTEKTGRNCLNGACLSSQCYCNDGFGGKGCEMPDENECKFRPCDIFAHCTNTMGSYYCSCFPGYEGDGFRCTDIDECRIPTFRSTCVENAECWNLPGHYSCRCLPGFEGDGKTICQDVNECLSNPCGNLSTCEEKVGGGFTCRCLPGYTRNQNPNVTQNCVDLDECSQIDDLCGTNSECQNVPGSYECVCRQGYLKSNNLTTLGSHNVVCEQVNVRTTCKSNFDCVNNAECNDGECSCRAGFQSKGAECLDVDECDNSPCGRHAVCGNVQGGFRCDCDSNFPIGDPFSHCKASCEDVNCGPHAYCSSTEKHSESDEVYCVCDEGWTYDPKNVSAGCVDLNECDYGEGKHGSCGQHSICHNEEGSFSCSCEKGFVTAGGNFKSGCHDVNECENGSHNCGLTAHCTNTLGSFECSCPKDTFPDPDPRTKCTKIIKCTKDDECPGNGACDTFFMTCACPEPNVGTDCRHPCEGVTCGPRAECILVNDKPTCACPSGFYGSPNGIEGCLDIDECLFRPCGEGICRNEPGKYRCECPLGFEPIRVQNSSGYAESCRSVSPRSCKQEKDCPNGEECVDHTANQKVCICPKGFTRDLKSGECRDVNECLSDKSPCGFNALCRNLPGRFDCTCPQKYPVGNPYLRCEECTAKRCHCPPPFHFMNNSCVMDNCSPRAPCRNGAQCISVSGGLNYCACTKGHTMSTNGSCQDANECLEDGICGPGAECVNKPGTFECICPINYQGDPYKEGCSHPLFRCHTTTDCKANEQCVGSGICVCAPPFQKNGTECKLLCDISNEGAYKVCVAQRRTCVAANCGKQAECIDGVCVCKSGFQGDPYSVCEDVNECEKDMCGKNARCMNLEGSFDCRCELEHPSGNPFVECYKPSQNLIDCGRSRCNCNPEKTCPEGFICQEGICLDQCDGIICGPNSVCNSGKCTCMAEFSGENGDCESKNCENDLSCSTQEICYAVPGGRRICIDGCSKIQCGPNSICFTDNHRSSCVCKDLFVGDGQDCQSVKISERVDECVSSMECYDGFICSMAPNGVRKCIDPCLTTHCDDLNQHCVREREKAVCKCKSGFIISQANGVCGPPALSDCSKDEDCGINFGCIKNAFGVSNCKSLCEGTSCGQNAVCIPNVRKMNETRRASCHCKPGFTGNPENRIGCVSLVQVHHECEDDVDCSENHVCHEEKLGRKCKLACDELKCGPNAICISNNHAAQCHCLPGKYKGDPFDILKGCQPVPCIYNSDCLSNQTCNRLQNECHDVCRSESCGKNAICIPEKHTYRCACAFGFSSLEPENGCSRAVDCSINSCHSSAICQVHENEVMCKCREGESGDPYGKTTDGCKNNAKVSTVDSCSSHEECPPETICRDQKCVNPCANVCAGLNSICRVVDRVPACSCQVGFEATTRNNETTCTRQSSKCTLDTDCVDAICVDGQCKVICQERSDCTTEEFCLFGMCMLPCIGDVQCPAGQTCAGGYCVMGCRNNKECSLEEACLNHQCSNPCNYDGVCGANSLCRVISHSPQCYCPDGFISSPFDGCYRNQSHCSTTRDCPNAHLCIGSMCFLSCESTLKCARGEQCQNNICVKVCHTDSNCQLGEICVEGICGVGCRSDTDCAHSETCLSNKCHCSLGFTSGPTGCRDVNECDESGKCHPTAICLNSPGSFRCECPLGLVSENPRVTSCNPPQECFQDGDCLEHLNCLVDAELGILKCLDPCHDKKCGLRAECSVSSHKVKCHCPFNFLGGDPYSMDIGCYAVECTQATNCSDDKYCDPASNRCVNPCDEKICGSHSHCVAEAHQGTCSCLEGFLSGNGSCIDVNECKLETPSCHSTAICINSPGGFSCECPQGTVGEPKGTSGCKAPNECTTSTDCPTTAICVEGKCKNGCEGACGTGTTCETVDHKLLCSCLPNYIGDPNAKCTPEKCADEKDCAIHETCYNHECKSPCDIPQICGQNSNCSVISHKALCICMPDYTGDPVIGCLRIVSCDAQTPCSTSSFCQNGFCHQRCTSHRDCLPIQSCFNSLCQSPCTFDSDCSISEICETGVCQEQAKCTTNSNCKDDEICEQSSTGISECQPACRNETNCSRNSHCKVKDHSPTCECNVGFTKDRLGNDCVQLECQADSDCPNDKGCVDYKCQFACKLVNDCPQNSICIAENHQQKCACQPGFFPSNFSKDGSHFTCTATDFCVSNPCGDSGRCENNDDTFTCLCELDQVKTPSGKCESILRCQKNKDCPDSAYCTSGNCSYVCSPRTCGPHSKCIFRNHAFHGCECRPGYVHLNISDPLQGCIRNPEECTPGVDCIKKNSFCTEPECLGSCESHLHCSPTETCMGTQCRNPCDDSNACGMNSICRIHDHVKTCHCLSEFTGVPEVECVRIAIPCHSAGDCPPSQGCGNGICMPKCDVDLQCATNERCKSGNCMLTCRVDDDCFLNHICVGSMCTIGCRSNGDCSTEESCQNQKCVNLCMLDVCGPNSLCQTVDHQPKCSCPSGMLPNPTPHLGCIRERFPCSGNRDCREGSLCVGRTCKQGCSQTQNCFSNEICHGGFCSLSCRKDLDCNGDTICENSVCIEGCRTDITCKDNQACLNKKCYNPCQLHCDPASGNCSALELLRNNPCGSNSLCTVENHKGICNCLKPYIGDGYSCTSPEIHCTGEDGCPQDMTCLEDKCRVKCSSDEKCQLDERCIGGLCKPLCSQDDQCGLGKICQGRICLVGCRMDDHCPSNLACVNHQCKDPCHGNTTCGTCAMCETVDHRRLCSCPVEWAGTPQSRCYKPYMSCLEGECRSEKSCVFGSCLSSCKTNVDCPCLQTCHLDHCHNQCDRDEECSQGQLCESGVCKPGCQYNSDCPPSEACVKGQCHNPCPSTICSKQSNRCKVSQHRPICLCPSGSPEVQGECPEGSCTNDSECKNPNDVCIVGTCKNPCLENGTCGNGASCRMINRKALCTCPSGWTGSPQDECVQVGKDDCRGRGCGINSTCSYTDVGFRCVCPPSCVPRVTESALGGCDCSTGNLNKDECNLQCGTHAKCKRFDNHQKKCICPKEFPYGDPMIACSTLERIDDCRIKNCGKGALCSKVNDLYECRCPMDTIGNAEVECVRERECRLDNECSDDEACVRGHCHNPCDSRHCERNETCHVRRHKAICYSSATLDCEVDGRQCSSSQQIINQSFPQTTTPEYQNVDGIEGKGRFCNVDSNCSTNRACNFTTSTCENPCLWPRAPHCRGNQECKVQKHLPLCICTGFIVTEKMELICPDVQPQKCNGNKNCPSNLTCVFGTCQDPCVSRQCPIGKTCETLHHAPYCLCNTSECQTTVEICIRDSGCPKNLTCVNYRCESPCESTICPIGQVCIAQNHKSICKPCKPLNKSNGDVECEVSADESVCQYNSDCGSDLMCLKGSCSDPCLTVNPCSQLDICRVENHTIICLTSGGTPETLITCQSDNQCPVKLHCSENGTCHNPCTSKKCGLTSYCVAENHTAKCFCVEGGIEHEGNCIRRFRTDFPRPEMTVNCLADGIQVDILTGPFGNEFRPNGTDFNGLLYVKGHSKDPQCRKSVQPFLETVDFEVKFGSCGLLHNDGEASFVLVIQKHPRLVTYNAQAYDIKCVYMTGEKTITLGFNVSMLTTAGTIANTGPPPTCSMRIATATGGEISSAEIGESLVLRIDVQPSSIYGGFARRCVAKTMEGDGENEYPVTDEDGCASDPSVFGDWEFETETQILMAHFNAFKFPSSSSIKFQCNVRVCFGTCQPVNCRGQDAFGRRKRNAIGIDEHLLTPIGYEGQLREEVQIESNPILAIERREDRFLNPTESPQTLKEEVCISTTGFILSLIVTSILSLVAVAVAVSCWILAYKRRRRDHGPLPHPPEFPNPLFTVTDLITEPSPDYLS